MKGKATTTEETKSSQRIQVSKVAYVGIPYGQPCTTPTAGQARYTTNELHRLPNGFLLSPARPPAAPTNHGNWLRPQKSATPDQRTLLERKKNQKTSHNYIECGYVSQEAAASCSWGRGMNQSEDVSLSVSPFISCFYFCMSLQSLSTEYVCTVPQDSPFLR